MKYDEDFLNGNSFYARCRQPAMRRVVYVSSDGERKAETSEGRAPGVALVSLDELF